MKTLLPHQLAIVRDDKEKVGMFLGTGVGKTLITLSLSRGETMTICPKTQKEDKNWERELDESQLKVKLKVISKETFKRDWESLPPCDTLILDEADTMLGVTPNVRYVKKVAIPKASQIFEAVLGYVRKHNPQRIYLATATITRTPMCVWAASEILGLGWNWYEFRDVFYIKLPIPGHEIWVPKKDSATKDRLARAVQSLGYTGRLQDYNDVPEQTFRTVYVELTDVQNKKIKDLPLDYPDPLALLQKTHQVENGILSGNNYEEPQRFSNNKIDKILDLALEFPQMILFVRYTDQIDYIRDTLDKAGYKTFVLNGQTKNRKEVIEEANNTKEYIFIAQSQISAGWEIPECPVMVFVSMTYSASDRIQGEGRIQRQKKIKKNLYIDLVVRGGIDEAVYKCIIDKKDFNERTYLNYD